MPSAGYVFLLKVDWCSDTALTPAVVGCSGDFSIKAGQSGPAAHFCPGAP